jgi:hypothetical protein
MAQRVMHVKVLWRILEQHVHSSRKHGLPSNGPGKLKTQLWCFLGKEVLKVTLPLCPPFLMRIAVVSVLNNEN